MDAYAFRVTPGGDVLYLATANMVGRREVFKAIPFPDRNIAEDVGFCWRALEADYDVVYTPDGIVTHEYRTSIRSFSTRQVAYGASEALLATDYDHGSSRRVAVPLELGCSALFGSIGLIASESIATDFLVLGTLLASLGLRFGSAIRTKIRVDGVVTGSDLVRSQLRQVVSTAYGVSREFTRYYAAPIALVGVVAVLWSPAISAVVVAALLIVVSLPLGVYRGLLAYRTLRPVNPFRRFRLAMTW